jgi:protein SCO1/2
MATISRPVVQLGGAYRLTDHHGRAVTDQTYLGRHVLIFFGFTHCKVVCPENLGKLSRVLEQLGPWADRIQPLYITVDPDRDSPEVMRAFLEERFPRFTGLTGDKAQIDEVKRAYKVFAAREDPDATGDYDVPHTAMTFLMAPDGAYVTHFAAAADAETVVARLEAILAAAPDPGAER